MGASTFVALTSVALAGSPVWSFLALGWAGYRASSSAGRNALFRKLRSLFGFSVDAPREDRATDLAAWDEERTALHRHQGLFLLLVAFAYYPAKRWRGFHQSGWWENLWFSHQGITVKGPKNLPQRSASEQLLYAVSPHGIFPFGLGFAALGPLRERVFGIQRVVVASATLAVPVLRHVIHWIGGVDASPSTVSDVLRAGETLAVAPGGVAEMFLDG